MTRYSIESKVPCRRNSTFFEHGGAVIRMNVLQTGAGLIRNRFKHAPKGRLEERIDEEDLLRSGIGDPEKLPHVLDELAKAVLGLATSLLTTLPLDGHQMPADPVQGFAQCTDDDADEEEENQGGDVVDPGKGETREAARR